MKEGKDEEEVMVTMTTTMADIATATTTFKDIPRGAKEHVLINGMSGVGKTYCCRKIKELYPENTVMLENFSFVDHIDQKLLYDTFLSLSEGSILIIDHPRAPSAILGMMRHIITSCTQRGIMVIFVENHCTQLHEYSLCRSGLLSKEIKITFSTGEQRQQLLDGLVFCRKSITVDPDLLIGCTPVDIISFINNGGRLHCGPSSLRGLERFIIKPTMKTYLTKEMVGVAQIKKEMLSLIDSCCRFGRHLHQSSSSSSFTPKNPPPRGMVVHGGSGKSRIVEEVCREASITTIGVSSCDIVSKYLGESEKNLSLLFERARVSAPSILFIDELDVLIGNKRDDGSGGKTSSSERLLTTMLIEMDGLLTKKNGDGVFVIGVIGGKLKNLDAALIREGRLSNLFKMPSMADDYNLGVELLLSLLEDMNIELGEDEISILLERIKGMSAPEIEGMLKEMIMVTLRKDPNATKLMII